MGDAIELGCEVEDPITGYKGVVVARTTYLWSTPKVLVEPRTTDDRGNRFEGEWFEEPRLILSRPAGSKIGFTEE